MDNQLAGENRILWPRVIGAVLVAALIVLAIWFVASRLTDDKQPAKPASPSSGSSQSQRQQASSPDSGRAATPPSSSTPAPATPPSTTGTAQDPSTSRPAQANPQPAPSTQGSPQLTNSGPGDVVKLFAGTSLAAGTGHYAFRAFRRRQRLRALT